ncbi:MAG: Trk system potassium transporter TrkA [Candidatus Neomarinimicrobiota bacterium]|nr:Trk system potassium transporter TrkA [Candidatus Neomarinimicrobiota bacterium]RKY47995.1 MAG: Trk system potassium transporter TrkA [Candidatus Neomarinimicrobiota bacterium]
MKVIIAGGGIIGSNLASTLSHEGHEVFLIEKHSKIANEIDDRIDAKIIVGEGTNPEILKAAHVEEADLVIAVTTSDETNLVIASLAALYGAKKRIARVRDMALTRALHELGLSKFYIDELINPENIASRSIVRAVGSPGAIEVADFAHGEIYFRAFNISENSTLCNIKLDELNHENFPWPFLITAIKRERSVIIPKGDTRLKAKDRIYCLLLPASAAEFYTFINPDVKKVKKVIIYGATYIGQHVAKTISKSVKDVILLEEDKRKAQAVAGILNDVLVISGSPSDTMILQEAGIETADVFIALSDDEHSNLISAVLARKLGAKKTIITTKHPDFMAIMDNLAIDVVINPRYLAADQITRWVRGEEITAITQLMEIDAEILELIPEENSPITRAPLKNLTLPKETLVGAVYRHNKAILASGTLQINPGELVIVFCRKFSERKLRKMFKALK